MLFISTSLLTGMLWSCTALRSSSSTLFRQLWQIHSGTSPSSDCDSDGTASASLRPGASLSRACESAGTASASFEPWLGSPLARPEPQSLNSRWHSKQHVCTDCGEERSSVRRIHFSLYSTVKQQTKIYFKKKRRFYNSQGNDEHRPVSNKHICKRKF